MYHPTAVEHKIQVFSKLIRAILAAAFTAGTDITLLAQCCIHNDNTQQYNMESSMWYYLLFDEMSLSFKSNEKYCL
jgi:hypothetical protein